MLLLLLLGYCAVVLCHSYRLLRSALRKYASCALELQRHPPY
jgi:hypothetical protein